MSTNKRQVRWANGLSNAEKAKMTGFTAGKLDSVYVSGISVSVPDYSHLNPTDRPDNLLINIMNCHGEDYKRYFTIPVNKVDEICKALQVIKKESILNSNGVMVSPK